MLTSLGELRGLRSARQLKASQTPARDSFVLSASLQGTLSNVVLFFRAHSIMQERHFQFWQTWIDSQHSREMEAAVRGCHSQGSPAAACLKNALVLYRQQENPNAMVTETYLPVSQF